MGILGYPNNDDKNTGDYSADLSNYQDDGIQNVDLVDAFPEADDLSFEEQAAVAADIPVLEQAVVHGTSGQQAYNNASQQRQAPPQNSGGGILGYLLIVGLLVVAVAVYIFVNKPFGEFGNAPQEQATGDYFYDQAVNTGATETVQADANSALTQNTMATVDVVLDEPTQSNDAVNVDKKDASVKDVKKPVAKAEEKKALTAYEKAMLKKAADEARSEQLGLDNKNGEVVIPVNSGGRLDPFLPTGVSVAFVDKPKFDLVAPPLTVPEVDPKIDTLMSLKISGIMYDNVRPSAILSVDGVEHLVHNGDLIMGYKIQRITRDKVVVSYQNNTYEVTAGQTLNRDNINVNPVSSVSKQFGGAYSSTSDKAIKIN